MKAYRPDQLHDKSTERQLKLLHKDKSNCINCIKAKRNELRPQQIVAAESGKSPASAELHVIPENLEHHESYSSWKRWSG